MTTSIAASLRTDTIRELAWERLGRDDVCSFDFVEGLRALTGSLAGEACLTQEGGQAVQQGLVACLVNQGRLSQAIAAHPEIERQPLGRPVFIIGLPRTGSTLVHNLLDQHPDLRCPALWELMTPAGSRDPAVHERLADAAQAYVEDYYRCAPRLPMIHPLDARRPDECHRITGNTFASRVFWMRHFVPSYVRWLERQDLTPVYEYHQLQLRSILWRIPAGTPVLKDPFHVWSLGPLARTYPTARFVHLHRDPAVCVASTCSLCAELRQARSDQIAGHEIGAFWASQTERALSGLDEARRTHLHGRRILDVGYRELTADPMAVMARICDFIEAPLTAEAEARMCAFLAENPLQRHGVHRYTAEEFGLDRGELRERFGDYCAAYDV